MNLPCDNPSCKSYGKPHPHCRCHGDMAKGGEVSHFCAKDREHEPDCEYFAAGGDASPDPASVVPDNASVGDSVGGGPQPENIVPDQPSEPDQASVLPDRPGSRYGTPEQQVLTGMEGAFKGVAGPLATGTELGLSKLGVPGLTAEDQVGRQTENPIIHGGAETAAMVGSMMIGTGEAALAMKAGEAAAKLAQGSKLGAAALKGMVANGLIQFGDEASKWALGQGDPQDAVGAAMARTGAAGLLGAGVGAAGDLVARLGTGVLEGLQKANIGHKAESFLAGLAEAAHPGQTAFGLPNEMVPASKQLANEYNAAAYKAGMKFFGATVEKMGTGLGMLAGVSHSAGGDVADLAMNYIVGGMLGKVAGKGLSKAGKAVVGPTVLKMLQSESVGGMFEAMNHNAKAAAGLNMIEKSIEDLFHGQALVAHPMYNSWQNQKKRDQLDEYISNNGLNQEMQQQLYKEADQVADPMSKPAQFAEGGEVGSDPVGSVTIKAPPILEQNKAVAQHYPEQNLLATVAKGRVAQYLGNLKPVDNQPRLAFESPPDLRDQQRSYKRALDIAVHPLGVMQEIKKGTVEAEHIKHLNSMYPELVNVMQKKITQKIVDQQIKGEKPNYRVRQGLSMLMGTPLSPELKPENIQAAQRAHQQGKPAAAQQQKPQAGAKPAGSPKALSKSDQAYLTGGQALAKRGQKI